MICHGVTDRMDTVISSFYYNARKNEIRVVTDFTWKYYSTEDEFKTIQQYFQFHINGDGGDGRHAYNMKVLLNTDYRACGLEDIDEIEDYITELNNEYKLNIESVIYNTIDSYSSDKPITVNSYYNYHQISDSTARKIVESVWNGINRK